MLPPATRRRPVPPPTKPSSETTIINTGADGFYLTPKATCANINKNALHVIVGTAGNAPHRSPTAFNTLLSQLPTTTGHIMPHFHHNLMGIGPLCNHD